MVCAPRAFKASSDKSVRLQDAAKRGAIIKGEEKERKKRTKGVHRQKRSGS
jgi:hypothetical protein